MKQILELIENVDPEDTQALDEIDLAVLKYLHGDDWKRFTTTIEGRVVAEADSMFCTSRDALKSIRPEGKNSYASIEQDYDWSWSASIENLDRNGGTYHSPQLPTEELAELHAIIQAISHDRGEDAG